MNKIQLTYGGLTPTERQAILEGASRSGVPIGKYLRNALSSTFLEISSSDLLTYLGKRKNRKLDVPRFTIKETPSKVTFLVDSEVYEKVATLSKELNVSKSVIVHCLYNALINGSLK